MEQEYSPAVSAVSSRPAAVSSSESLWTILITACQLMGFALIATGAVILVQKSNSVIQFIGIKDRTPTVSSMRYVGEIMLIVLGILLLLVANQTGERARAWISRNRFELYQRWRGLRFPIRLLITGVLLLMIAGWNMNQILSTPFSYNPNYDMRTGVYRTDKEKQVNETINGLRDGCLLCAIGGLPIENRTTGDDIGLFFFFGVGHKLGFFPASLDGYQQFVAVSYTAIVVLCAVVVMAGFRSLVAGIVLAIIITLLDTTKSYESLLITSYWVPAGAGLLSASMTLGLLGRADRDHRSDTKPAYKFYYALFGVWGLAAGCAYLGRSAVGPITLVSALVVLVILIVKLRPSIRWLPALGLLGVGFAVVLAIFQFALTWRLARYNLPPPVANTMSSHPFSHAVLVGMGYVTNDEGLTWNDSVGASLAELECPGATYLGPAYYNCVRDLAIRIIVNDPNLLIRNVLAKIESTIQVTFGFLPWAMLSFVGLYLIRRPAYYLAFGFLLALNVAPALLTVPYPSYLQGYFQIILVSIAAGVILFGLRLADHFEGKTLSY